jgi:hypothetical protein
MGWRVAGIALGCAGVVAASAAFSSHYFGRGAPAAAAPVPAFMTAALQAPLSPSWPPANAAIAFPAETLELLNVGARIAAAAREAAERDFAMAYRQQQHAVRKQQPKARAEQPRTPETIDIQVRDRFGRVVQSRRVPREGYDEPYGHNQPYGYAPPRPRMLGPFFGEW